VVLGRRGAGLLAAGACCLLAACESDKPPPATSLNPDTRVQVAEAAEAAGERDLALSMYITAAESAPGDIKLQLRCVQALTQAGKITQARDLLTSRLKAMPEEVELTRALGLLNLVSGEPAQAAIQLDKVLAKNPDDVRARVDKAVALDLQRRHAEAQGIYRQVLQASPNDPVVRNNLALSLMLDGKIREAQEQLASVKDLDASPERLKVNLGIIYAATGDLDKSRQLLGGRISDSELARLTQAITTSRAGRGNGL
jgi:Flp pilus assembly protein TadD